MRTRGWGWLAPLACVLFVGGWMWQRPAIVPGSGNQQSMQKMQAPGIAMVRVSAPLSVTGKAQAIDLDADKARKAVRDRVLRVVLADGSSYPVHIERQETDAFGQWTVIGRVQSPVGAQAAVLTFGGNAVFGVLPLPDGHAMQIVTNHGAVVATMAGGMVPPGRALMPDTAAVSGNSLQRLLQGRMQAAAVSLQTDDRAVASAPVARMPAKSARIMSAAAGVSTVTITVLATYGDDLVALRGSVAAVQTELSNLIAAANQAHVDSGTRVRLSLVGTQKLDIPSSMENYDALYAMTSAPVGAVDTELLRDSLSADLVTFVRPYAGYENCGIAWVGGAGLHGTDVEDLLAYSVVNREPCGPNVMAHEIGHNLGSAHDRATDTSVDEIQHGAYPFGFGYRRTETPAFATVMAYAQDEPWLARFSDPLSTACGAPCGVPGRSDNVSSLNRMAKAISQFRGTPGAVVLTDAEAWEPAPYMDGKTLLTFRVRMSGYAPPAGATFHATVVGGTADQQDVVPILSAGFGTTLGGNSRDAFLSIELQGDDAIEPDETIVLKITNDSGIPMEVDTATGTIRNDDPRPRLKGRVWIPPNIIIPTSFNLKTAGVNGMREQENHFWLQPPDYRFDIPVIPGANVQIDPLPPSPIVGPRVIVNEVERDRYEDIVAAVGITVSGKVVPPTGMSTDVLAPAYHLEYRETQHGRVRAEDDMFLGPPCYCYSKLVFPGATVDLYGPASGSSSYAPYERILQVLRQDTTADVMLSTSSSIVVFGGHEVREGAAGNSTRIPIGIQVMDRLPRSQNLTVHWRTVNGTATGGEDFASGSGNITFAPNESLKTVFVDVLGDGTPERGGEYFDVVVDPVAGFNLSNPSTRTYILEDDRLTGGPMPAAQQ